VYRKNYSFRTNIMEEILEITSSIEILANDSLRLDWIVQCFTSPPTQYRLYGRRFLQVKRPNQQYQSTEGESTKEKTQTKQRT